ILLALSQLLLTTTDEKTILNLAAKTAAELLNTGLASIVLPDARTSEPTVVAVEGWPASVAGDKPQQGIEPLGQRAVEEAPNPLLPQPGQPLAVEDYARALALRTNQESSNLAGLSVPMSNEGHVVGAMFVHSRNHRNFDQEDTRLLTLVANQTAAALERA